MSINLSGFETFIDTTAGVGNLRAGSVPAKQNHLARSPFTKL